MLALYLPGECTKFVSCEAALCPAVMVRADPAQGVTLVRLQDLTQTLPCQHQRTDGGGEWGRGEF